MGGNLGDPARTLAAAARALARLGRPVAASSLYRTAPVGGPTGQGDYLNAVLVLEPATPWRSPERLMAALTALEIGAGRVRREPSGPRTLDLDLISLGRERRDGPSLVLPHPRALVRAFVMVPLAEAWPLWRAPDGRTAAEVAASLPHDGVAATGRRLLAP